MPAVKKKRHNHPQDATSLAELRQGFFSKSEPEIYTLFKDLVREVYQKHIGRQGIKISEEALESLVSEASFQCYKLSPRQIVTGKGNRAFVFNAIRGKKDKRKNRSVLYVISGRNGQLALYHGSQGVKKLQDSNVAHFTDSVCKGSLYRFNFNRFKSKSPWGPLDKTRIDLESPEKIVGKDYWAKYVLENALKTAVRRCVEQYKIRRSTGEELGGVTGLMKARVDAVMPGLIQARWREFSEMLHPDLFLPDREMRALNIDYYNFCAEPETDREREYRVQWCESFPFFVDHQDLDLMREAGPIIDQALPFNRAFSERHGATVAHVRRLASQDFSGLQRVEVSEKWSKYALREGSGLNSFTVFKLLSDVPVSNIPELAGGAEKEIGRMWLTLKATWDYSGYPNGESRFAIAKQLITNTRGRWHEVTEALEPHSDVVIRDIRDFTESFYKSVFVPLVLRNCNPEELELVNKRRLWSSPASSDFQSLITGERHLGQLLRLSEQWHKIVGHVATNRRIGDRSFVWQPLCPSQTAPDGTVLFPLTSSSALRKEGSDMHNCVGSYDSRCATSGCHIIAVRDRENKPLATLQLSETGSGVKESQLRGHSNGQVEASVRSAVAWYINRINSGEIEIDFKKLAESRVAPGLSSICNFDPEKTERCIESYEEFRWALPPEFRKLDWESFSGHPKILDLIEQAKTELFGRDL